MTSEIIGKKGKNDNQILEKKPKLKRSTSTGRKEATSEETEKILSGVRFSMFQKTNSESTDKVTARRLGSTICKLATRQIKPKKKLLRSFVANFREDSVILIRKIPLLPIKVPLLLILLTGDQITSQYFKVSCKYVEILWQVFLENHPGFVANSVTFSQEQCDIFPENDVLDEISQIIPLPK